MPAPTPRTFPSRCPASSWSRKKRDMPSSVTATVSTSAFATRFPRKMAENTTMNTGDVNCSTMALAAVVSLLAATNSVNVPQSATRSARSGR